jgi:hypothetical protein
MTKFAVNIMGTFEDTSNGYNAAQVEELFEIMQYKFETLKVVGVSAKALPDDHIVVQKNLIKRRTGKLGLALDKNKK